MMKYLKKPANLLLPCLVSFLLLASSLQIAAEEYYNSFSKMMSMTSMWQNNFYNDIIRSNAARGSFRELANASRITQQEIQNLCKPFPCGNESSSNSPPPQTPTNQAPIAPPQAPITATDFPPVGGRIMPDEIARTSEASPEEKEGLRTLSNQILNLFEAQGRPNNIANSFAFLVEVSLKIATGKEVSDPEEALLISSFNNSLAHIPQFLSMPARDKQVLNESAIIAAGLMDFLNEQGKQNNDAQMQTQASDMSKAVIAHFFGVQLK
jgi:hypothetical protein